MTILRLFFCVLLSITYSARVDAQGTIKRKVPLISSHRGASRLAPENTGAAFIKAIDGGTDFIEIDVRTTSDGQQVIVHDKSLKRTTGLNALVSDTDYATIKALSAGDWFSKDYTSEKVPTLEQICVLLNEENKRRNRNVKLYVDCKEIDAAKVTSLLKKYELIDSAVFYGDEKTLTDIRKYFSRARLMPAFPGRENAHALIKKLKPYAFDVSYGELDAATVAFIHANGIKVFSDLLGKDDNTEAYLKAVEFGIDLIQTDDANAVRNSYEEFQTRAK